MSQIQANGAAATVAAAPQPAYAPAIFTPDESNWLEPVPGEKLLVRVSSPQVGGRYAIVESVASPGSGTPLHVHAQDEVFHLLGGTMTFMIADEVVEASAGTTVVVPAGTPHAWKNRSSTPVRTLTTFTPGDGIENMFKAIQGLQPEQLVAVAEKFGTAVVGPPLD